MKFLKLPAFVCVALAMTAIVSAQDDSKLEPAQLVGEWKFESGERAGAEVAKERLGTVSIDDEAFTIPVPGAESFVMAYKIDNSQSPAHVDMDITGGPAPPSSAVGIIAVKDGKIMLCYDPTGTERPDDFSTSDENGFHMFVIAKDGLSADKLVGTWNYSAGMRAGEEVGAERLVGEVVFTEKTVTLPAGGDMKFVMSYEIDASSSPASIDLEIKEGPVPEGSAKGIIKIENGEIVFCYNAMGGDRPTDFDTNADNGNFMFKMKPAEDKESSSKGSDKK